jgi:uncharacterized membrane protein YhaH (DUF805 family)
MSFFDAVKSVYSNYTNFGGRARRSEYWWFYLFSIIVNIVLDIMMEVGGGRGSDNPIALIGSIAAVVWGLGTILPQLAVGVRRLHDSDRSGWWLLLWCIPIIGWIILIIWLCQPSVSGTNKYGPNPINPIDVAKVF